MPKVTVGDQSAEIQEGKRLVLAIEQELGVDILHRCGGYAQCTTCRVTFHNGEPQAMTAAEKERLEAREILGEFRLSCQVPVSDNMNVEPAMRVSTTEFDEPGDTPETEITPEPEWVEKP